MTVSDSTLDRLSGLAERIALTRWKIPHGNIGCVEYHSGRRFTEFCIDGIDRTTSPDGRYVRSTSLIAAYGDQRHEHVVELIQLLVTHLPTMLEELREARQTEQKASRP